MFDRAREVEHALQNLTAKCAAALGEAVTDSQYSDTTRHLMCLRLLLDAAAFVVFQAVKAADLADKAKSNAPASEQGKTNAPKT
jgi:hypothetical protein